MQNHELGQRSTYHYRSTEKADGLTDAELTSIIEDIQDELTCYGYRRVTHELRRHGCSIHHKRIARVMRLPGLGIKPRRRCVRTTDSRHHSPIFPNLYCNHPPSSGPGLGRRLHLYPRCDWVLLSGGHSRCLQPQGRRICPVATSRHTLFFVGNRYHNAQVKRIMKTLNVEEVYRAGYEAIADVATRLPMFIEQIYTSKRLHSALGDRTPEEFETLFARKAA